MVYKIDLQGNYKKKRNVNFVSTYMYTVISFNNISLTAFSFVRNVYYKSELLIT